MAAMRIEPGSPARIWLTVYVVLVILGGTLVFSQAPPGSPPGQDQIVEVRIRGNNAVPAEKIIPNIRTRAGRPYDADEIEKDVRRLYQTRKFVKVTPITEDAPGGKVVIFELLERPTLQYIKVVGNQKIKKKTLVKELHMKAGDGMDPYAVEDGRRKLIEYYHSKGFSKVHIEIAEGNKPNDRGAIYVINEGPKQRILWVNFIGNTISSDARLTTQIKSKPGILWIFKGEVDRKQIEEDVNRLTAYYRSLGFFSAYVGRPILDFNEDQNWLTLTFVIDEGPRYRVRNIKIIGNKLFSTPELSEDSKLHAGEYFLQSDRDADVAMMTDIYGGEGYIFTEVKPELRFLEQPGELDLVYNIKESPRYRVGRINVEIKGEYPHTKINTVLNRLSLQPGDICDTRELRASERRLKASGLFRNDPSVGIVPKINIVKSDSDTGDETEVASRPRRPDRHDRPGRPSGFRGQSPDPEPREQIVDLALDLECADAPGTAQSTARACITPAGVQVQPLEERGMSEPARAPFQALPPPAAFGSPEPGPDGPAQPLPPDAVIRGQSPDAPGNVWQPASPGVLPAQPSAAPQPAPSGNLRWGTPIQRQGTAPRTNTAPAGAAPFTVQSPPARTASIWDADPARASPATTRYAPSEVLRGQDTYNPNDGFLVPSQSPPMRSAGPLLQPVDPGLDRRGPLRNTTLLPGPAEAPVYPESGPPNAGMARPETTAPPGGFLDGPVLGGPTAGGGAPLIQDPGSPYGPPTGEEPPLYVPLNPELEETQTGRFMFSVGVNSDLGVVGSIVIDEQNFDWTRFPRSWEEIRNATAWRGAGQHLRIEAMPGSRVQRYAVNWTEPYFMDTRVSLGLGGYFYERRFFEWQESRAGGRVALGYQFVPDLSGTLAYRGENVKISEPISAPGVVPDLDEVLGYSTLHGFRVGLNLDKRDNPFLATEGYLLDVGFEQVVGTFQYPRADLDFRKYFLLHQHPDGSGRHVLSLNTRVAVTGNDTPIYDRYYAGGFSSLRGFDFRGASPRHNGVVVGGDFMLLNSVEYLFPITADDALRGIVFCDTGTVEPKINNWTDRYRVAPGFGLRITVPAMGPAPIALDFAFPIVKEPGDDRQVFSFFVGFLR